VRNPIPQFFGTSFFKKSDLFRRGEKSDFFKKSDFFRRGEKSDFFKKSDFFRRGEKSDPSILRDMLFQKACPELERDRIS
jgi:hypothetical protein